MPRLPEWEADDHRGGAGAQPRADQPGDAEPGGRRAADHADGVWRAVERGDELPDLRGLVQGGDDDGQGSPGWEVGGVQRYQVVVGRAVPVHLGGTTQVWDATISNQTSGKTIALFRCTQLILQRRG